MTRKPARCRECKAVIKHGRCDCRQRVKAYLPSAAVIAAECAKIRAAWSDETEIQRRCRQNVAPDYGKRYNVRTEGDA